MFVCLSVSQNLDKAIWSHLVPNLVTPCTKPCHTLYQTQEHLVPDPGVPCTRHCYTLYQTLPVHRERPHALILILDNFGRRTLFQSLKNLQFSVIHSTLKIVDEERDLKNCNWYEIK